MSLNTGDQGYNSDKKVHCVVLTECTPFNTMINLSRGSIYFKIIDPSVE